MTRPRFAVVASPVGPLTLEAGEAGLARVGFGVEPTPGAVEDADALEPFARALAEYFAGDRRDFADVPVDLERGTPFERAVWRELEAIPYGRTITYADLARRVGNPLAVRAVGRANGRNPVPIVVPCHRVVASTGGLGGYAAPLHVKARLLALEGARPQALLPEA